MEWRAADFENGPLSLLSALSAGLNGTMKMEPGVGEERNNEGKFDKGARKEGERKRKKRKGREKRKRGNSR